MKETRITYSMLRVTAPFENDRVEVEVELAPHDCIADAAALAKKRCEEILAMPSAAALKKAAEIAAVEEAFRKSGDYKRALKRYSYAVDTGFVSLPKGVA